MDDLMRELVNFVTETQFEDLPSEVVHETKRILLDCAGCAIGAPGKMERGKICKELASRFGGKPESTILGTKGKVSCINAAFANAELINALDFDAPYGNHLPPCVIPAPLAVGEIFSASGKDVILSIALGLEVAMRLKNATPSAYTPIKTGREKGKISFSPVCGNGTAAFGAAIAAGTILNLSPKKMASAMGIAGYAGPPSTFRKWTDTVPCRMTKYGAPGFTAEVGVKSAFLAEMGYYGDTDIFEGNYGYWRFTGHQGWDKDSVLSKIGETWKCTQISYKKYPAGH